MRLATEWQFIATLTVNRVPVDGFWDGFDGGDTTSDARSYRPGGQLSAVALPSAPTTTDITLERAFRLDIDNDALNYLANNVGAEASVTLSLMRPDDGRPVPNSSRTISGVLKEVSRPTFRSEGDAVATYRVVVTPSGRWGPVPA